MTGRTSVFVGANLALRFALEILASSGIALAAAGHVIIACAVFAIAVANGVILRRAEAHS